MNSVIKRLFPFLFLSFAYKVTWAQPVRIHRVNPDFARGGAVSQIFDSVTYIPLETTKASTFGSINNLQVSAHYFVFFDNDTKSIFVFDKKGKFISKICLAPNFTNNLFGSLSDFVLNPYNECIYISYYYTVQRRVKHAALLQTAVFKPDGQVSRIIKMDTALFRHINYSSYAFLDSNTAFFSRETRDTSSRHYFVLLKDFKEEVQNFAPLAPSDPFIDYAKNYHVYGRAKGYSAWTRNHDFDVDVMEGTSLLKYRFVFPAHLTMDSSVYKDTAMMKNGLLLATYNNRHLDRITNIEDFHKSDNILTFLLSRGSSYTYNNIHLMNLTTGNLYSFGRITPDSTNSFLPLIDKAITASDKDYLYSSIPSFTLFEQKTANESRHPVYNQVMQQFFATENRKSNPVIVQLKPKRNL